MEKIRFQAGTYLLEGLLTPGQTDRGVVITHPHPLYGGDMYNVVAESVADVYSRKGWTTLRFNFRGVGNSEGTYDNGNGEQEDVRAAILCLRDRGVRQIHLAGYSFGAWVSARLDGEAEGVRRMIMVSPPVSFIEFTDIPALPHLGLVVTGEHDEFAAPEQIRALLPTWNPQARFEVIPDTDHFYGGALRDLESVLGNYLNDDQG
ncbi:alpha/beta hydrolase [Desulfonema ishimotonii]|uniref:Alpha/beta hydrolase n=1 Tax=Desulfonema ishimotonii TaxID=45657 RepID=A0A401G4C3_9BACT|nr:alpha/beta hydrolase [Desulfonema ishimotonii]